MNQVRYIPNSSNFNYFCGYVEHISLKHLNLPEPFINKEQLKDVVCKPEVSFSMSMQEMADDVFKTNFDVKICYVASGKDCETNADKSYTVYELTMCYSALTNIADSKNVDEVEKKRILLVDVAYLAFPAIKHQIFNITRETQSTPVNLNCINFCELFTKEQAEKESQKA